MSLLDEKYTNKYDKTYFVEKIQENLEGLKEQEGQGNSLKDTLDGLNRLKEHVYGLRDTFGLYTADHIEEMSHPVLEEIRRIEQKLAAGEDEDDA